MDLISWGLSAMDSIFSAKKASPSEPNCPEGTYSAGYAYNYYKEWTPICLGVLSVEDVEDIWICCLLGIGLAGIGALLLTIFQKVRNPPASPNLERLIEELKASLAEISKTTAINSGMCAHKFNEVLELNKSIRLEMTDRNKDRQELESLQASVRAIKAKLGE